MNISKLHTCTGHRAAVYTLAAGMAPGKVLSAGGDGWIVEWDLQDPERGQLLATVKTQVFSLVSLPEQHRLVAGNMHGGLHWVDLQQPDRTRNIQHHQKGVFDLVVQDHWLFSAGGDGMLTRWSLETAQTVESLRLSGKSLRTLCISEPRNELAVGASDGSIFLLDLGTLALKQTLELAHDPAVFTIQYTPDHRYLLSGGRDAMLRVWALDEQPVRLVSEQAAHWFTINHIACSPDGRYFATASRDKSVKVWNATDFQLLKVLDPVRDGAHINSANRLWWDGSHLVSSSDDRTLIIWTVKDDPALI
ncbi:MAG: WD40 repeat domain-containing protein [Bacteroidetes bacterium]|nr:MAG: WD40 repeat domain-containing protein [Bacteroidota bacterium]